MKRSLLLMALLTLAPAGAHGKTRAAARPATSAPVAEREAKADRPRAARSDDDGETSVASGKTADGKTIKTKTYTFGAMDVEGKLKTPQLLYFLNRVKLELDMSAPDKRSFMKELAKSSEDKSL